MDYVIRATLVSFLDCVIMLTQGFPNPFSEPEQQTFIVLVYLT